MIRHAGYIISVNSSLEKMCSFDRKELIGKHASILTIVADYEKKKMLLEKAAILLEKGFATYEAVYTTRGGDTIHVECNSSMIKEKREIISPL